MIIAVTPSAMDKNRKDLHCRKEKGVVSLFVTPPMASGAFRANAGTIPGRSRKDSRPLFFSDPGMVKLCREDSEIAPLLKGILVELSFNGKSKKNIQLPKPGSVSHSRCL